MAPVVVVDVMAARTSRCADDAIVVGLPDAYEDHASRGSRWWRPRGGNYQASVDAKV
uniref:Uncharacterized protein n=1 Tax=Oryza sativa subsp. japonica TaxID=39947 RepID=Q6Z241_ORYSJ|nr:hypothetical protein [Oryza sativa Japonica Group]BAD10273.1 hypothetical protein [Oryza sativa Japonica Group]